jgi:hypothetical protein
MLKALIEKVVAVVDDAGVETVLTLAFVAQFVAYVLPWHGVDARAHLLLAQSDVVEVGTVVQMPAKPNGSRTGRATVASKGTARSSTADAPKPARLRRPAPVDDDLGAEEIDHRAAESSVRITVIGPDGQPRTKIVRLSGSRDGTAAPARRPHD